MLDVQPPSSRAAASATRNSSGDLGGLTSLGLHR